MKILNMFSQIITLQLKMDKVLSKCIYPLSPDTFKSSYGLGLR